MSAYTIIEDRSSESGSIECEDLPRGYSLRYRIKPDDCSNPPWENEDGHGPVRWTDEREKPARGETVLYSDYRNGQYFYNQGAAFVQAWKEGWGISAESLQRLTRNLGKKPTKGQIRAQAVREDMAHLRGFLSGDWCYIGVVVELIGPDSAEPIDTDSLWGIESNGDYWEVVAGELADQLLHSNGLTLVQRGKAWRDALHEARETKYWACRDVATSSQYRGA
jgi:hypothetical protein